MSLFLLHSYSDTKYSLIRCYVKGLKEEEISESTVKEYGFYSDSKSDWLSGRYPVPLITLKGVDSSRIESICIRGGKRVLPPQESKELAYLSGVVLGDGHVKGYTRHLGYPLYAIIIEKLETHYSRDILPSIIKSIFGLRPKVYFHTRKSRLVRISIASKIIHRVFTNLLKFSAGAKTSKPLIVISEWSDELKLQFVAGLFDTDGGRSGGSYSLGNNLKEVIDFARIVLEQKGIKTKTYTQQNKNAVYYHLYVRQKSRDNFLQTVPVLNERKFEKRNNSKIAMGEQL